MVSTGTAQSGTISYIRLSSLKLYQIKSPEPNDAIHISGTQQPPYGFGWEHHPEWHRLASCGESSPMSVNSCVVLMEAREGRPMMRPHTSCLAQGRLFQGFSGSFNFLLSLPSLGNQGAESFHSALYSCLQDIAKLSNGEEGLPRGQCDSQAPHRLTALTGPSALPARVAQCIHPLAFSTHGSNPLDACPLALRLFLNSKSQAYKIEQHQQQKSLRTTYWLCHRFNLLKCFQSPHGDKHHNLFSKGSAYISKYFSSYQVPSPLIPYQSICPEGSQPA